ncbi:polyketide cyclase [Ensifer sp. Root423]|uniref:SRPBCC family protein n=1 Tax=Ensifer TaxID=106591 RepID=UPI0007159B21|nr:SRPBCC family protein [Ensifer sp. Root423]KQX14476.1 polyketide cyclase [Ensifer sp. Root423]
MNERSAGHATFVIRRSYAATPATVFHAFADPATKRRWFFEGEGWTVDEFTSSFEVGGREHSRFRFGNGPVMCNDTIYLEIVANKRIVFSYTMTVAGRPISASLGTLEFSADGEGTRLNYTEQAAFLDRLNEPGEREVGFRELFQALADEIERAPADA